jgi:hypothetical protein
MRWRVVSSVVLALLTLLALSVPALAVPSKPAVVRSGSTLPNLQWLLRNSLSGGVADISFVYGTPARGDQPVFGDWNGDGTKTPGVRRANQFLLRNSNTSGNAEVTLTYGVATDFPVVGDWNGDGTDTVGVVRVLSDGHIQWLLRNSNTGGSAEINAVYGLVATDFPVVGDWNGDGTDTVGVVRGAQWLLRNSNTGGSAQVSFTYGSGAADEFPLVWR